ncbi:hypothetical protein C8J57DRAFT_1711658 [Mycena rebaudengoi]|nr:hypothetical protein C8J57DRAFT_1711658 [Mycena rebaudengoi]
MPCTWAGSCCAMYTMRTGGGHPALTLRAAHVLVWLWMVGVVRPLGMRTAPLAAELAMARSEGVALRISSQGGWMGGAWWPSRWWSFAGSGLSPAAGDDAERARAYLPRPIDGSGVELAETAFLAAGFLVLLAMMQSGGVACVSSQGGWMGAARYSWSSYCLRLRSAAAATGVNYVRGSLTWGPTTFLNAVANTYGWWPWRRGRLDDGFHTYVLELNEQFIRAYVDSRLHYERGGFPNVVQNGSESIILENPWVNGTKAAPFDQSVLRDFLRAQDQWYPHRLGEDVGEVWVLRLMLSTTLLVLV